jgi:Zn-dependent M28 family amino/carboxypeptidase
MRSSFLLSAFAGLSFTLAACAAETPPVAPEGAGHEMDRAQLLEDMRILASDEMQGREAGTEGGALARAYILERYEDIGVQPVGESFEYAFRFTPRGRDEEIEAVNLVGRIEGSGDSDHVMVVSAHYDHEGARDGQIWNGADDNASGVAAMLAVAEAFIAEPPAHDVLIVALDAEEMGLIGAREFVANPAVPLETIAFNLNLDMVAYSEERILWVVGTYHYPSLIPMVEEVAERSAVNFPMGFDEPTEERGGDWTMLTDSAAFHELGIPFIYLGVDFHPHYHQPTDTYENMTLDFFQDASETIVDFAQVADRELSAIAEAEGR